MSATVIPSVGPSMAEHLKSLRGGARPNFQEPLSSVEQLQHLFDRHRADVPVEEYLREICAARPAGIAVATFPLLLDSGNFFQGVSMPRVMDSLIRDNGNSVFKGLLADHVFGAIDKRRDGGLRILVRTEAAQKALIGEEVSVLGRKFRVGLESPLSKCFFLDVIGIRTSDEAAIVLGALATGGVKPVYFRPAAYDKKSGLCSATWRYYFPGEEVPPSLLNDDLLRQHVRVGKRSYRCFGKSQATSGRPHGANVNSPSTDPPVAVMQRDDPVGEEPTPTSDSSAPPSPTEDQQTPRRNPAPKSPRSSKLASGLLRQSLRAALDHDGKPHIPRRHLVVDLHALPA